MSPRPQLLETGDAAPAHPRAAPGHDTRARSLAKAVSYRLFATAVMVALAWAFTQRWAIAAAIAGADFVLKTALFYVHERLWARVGLGRAALPAPGAGRALSTLPLERSGAHSPGGGGAASGPVGCSASSS